MSGCERFQDQRVVDHFLAPLPPRTFQPDRSGRFPPPRSTFPGTDNSRQRTGFPPPTRPAMAANLGRRSPRSGPTSRVCRHSRQPRHLPISIGSLPTTVGQFRPSNEGGGHHAGQAPTHGSVRFSPAPMSRNTDDGVIAGAAYRARGRGRSLRKRPMTPATSTTPSSFLFEQLFDAEVPRSPTGPARTRMSWLPFATPMAALLAAASPRFRGMSGMRC